MELAAVPPRPGAELGVGQSAQKMLFSNYVVFVSALFLQFFREEHEVIFRLLPCMS